MPTGPATLTITNNPMGGTVTIQAGGVTITIPSFPSLLKALMGIPVPCTLTTP